MIEIDLDDHKGSDGLEQEAISESGLENMQPDPDKVATKLDLARAYMDMGDHDGTRDILDEVLADGNDDQKQEANDLMQKLN